MLWENESGARRQVLLGTKGGWSEGTGKGPLWGGVFEQRAEGVRGPSKGKSKCKGTEVTAQVGPKVSEGLGGRSGRGCVR